MCEANAYFVEQGDEELVMEAVDSVTPDGEGLCLTSIFGEQKFLKARILSLNLVEHKVFLEKTAE